MTKDYPKIRGWPIRRAHLFVGPKVVFDDHKVVHAWGSMPQEKLILKQIRRKFEMHAIHQAHSCWRLFPRVSNMQCEGKLQIPRIPRACVAPESETTRLFQFAATQSGCTTQVWPKGEVPFLLSISFGFRLLSLWLHCYALCWLELRAHRDAILQETTTHIWSQLPFCLA